MLPQMDIRKSRPRIPLSNGHTLRVTSRGVSLCSARGDVIRRMTLSSALQLYWRDQTDAKARSGKRISGKRMRVFTVTIEIARLPGKKARKIQLLVMTHDAIGRFRDNGVHLAGHTRIVVPESKVTRIKSGTLLASPKVAGRFDQKTRSKFASATSVGRKCRTPKRRAVVESIVLGGIQC